MSNNETLPDVSCVTVADGTWISATRPVRGNNIRVIFLDVDGVLNHMDFLADVQKHPYGSECFPDDGAMIDGRAVQRVQRIVDATGARIVLSSTWRLLEKMEQMNDWLQAKGLKEDLIDKTPNHGRFSRDRAVRGEEIQEWIDKNVTPEDMARLSFVILDDDDDMAHLRHRLIQTDFEAGLTDEHVLQAVAMLVSGTGVR